MRNMLHRGAVLGVVAVALGPISAQAAEPLLAEVAPEPASIIGWMLLIMTVGGVGLWQRYRGRG